jgi:hypothetical protein
MPPRLVVIDTQSVLDWLVFENPACAAWPGRLAADWKWVFTARMRGEFDHVVARGFGSRWPIRLDALATAWSTWGHGLDAPPGPLGPQQTLHCTDPDDQMFIDLAISIRAEILVTRDRALLRLGRRAAQRHGIRICAPAAW